MSKKQWSELRADEKAEQIAAAIFLQGIYYSKNKYKNEKRKINAICCTADPEVIGKSLYEIHKNIIDLEIRFRATGLYPYCEDFDRALHEMVAYRYIYLGNNTKGQEQYFFTIDNIKLFKFMSESVPEEIAKITFENVLRKWKFYCLFH